MTPVQKEISRLFDLFADDEQIGQKLTPNEILKCVRIVVEEKKELYKQYEAIKKEIEFQMN